ncbi:MAG: prepilin-type N-terminal cleavage/methylation domain-containing protein [Moritella sp.]|uniref:prepilin-type N-terminal cleavage/methylation domain-containing protein n=1 Tax=Moritella sp. TaxID=78556 RepID=UPI0029A7340C|nr:prepilin-type N-terminal cleavage/methylation domain-containing protein [Moritella sp.]MDX2321690.1 prepilin-type N-terminal cleavage/methylation domain-containing protein [Moritella sp.]
MKHDGFTLIELVIVIIILGILAATAVPKFINLQSDARISTLKGVEGAILSANNIIYSKAAIQGIEKSSGAIATGGNSTFTSANSIETVKGNIVMTPDNLRKAMTTSLHIVEPLDAGRPHADSTVYLSIDFTTTEEIQNSNCYVGVANDSENGSLYFTSHMTGC